MKKYYRTAKDSTNSKQTQTETSWLHIFLFFYRANNIFVLFEKLVFLIQAEAARTSDFVSYTTVHRAVGLSNINVVLD